MTYVTIPVIILVSLRCLPAQRQVWETWPRGRRHSPAKGASGPKPGSRVRIPPSPPIGGDKAPRVLGFAGLFICGSIGRMVCSLPTLPHRSRGQTPKRRAEPRAPTLLVVHRHQMSSSSNERRLPALQRFGRNLSNVGNGFAEHLMLIGVEVNPVAVARRRHHSCAEPAISTVKIGLFCLSRLRCRRMPGRAQCPDSHTSFEQVHRGRHSGTVYGELSR